MKQQVQFQATDKRLMVVIWEQNIGDTLYFDANLLDTCVKPLPACVAPSDLQNHFRGCQISVYDEKSERVSTTRSDISKRAFNAYKEMSGVLLTNPAYMRDNPVHLSPCVATQSDTYSCSWSCKKIRSHVTFKKSFFFVFKFSNSFQKKKSEEIYKHKTSGSKKFFFSLSFSIEKSHHWQIPLAFSSTALFPLSLQNSDIETRFTTRFQIF